MSAQLVAVLIGRQPAERFSVHCGYLDALGRLGAQPVLVPAGPHTDVAALDPVLRSVGGVLATGGGDVAPEHYGDQPSGRLMEVDTDRDNVEIAVLRMARSRGLRALGICRGAQILTAALGGRLHQHLGDVDGADEHWHETQQYEPAHPVLTEPGSLAAAVVADLPTVNSIHHQAIVDPGPHLAATAWSPDGVIEAVENSTALGLQWHPERLLAHGDAHLRAFRWLLFGRGAVPWP